MATTTLRMTVYDLAAGTPYHTPAGGHAFVYAVDGEALAGTTRLREHDGGFADGGAAVSTSGTAWIYEVAQPSERVRTASGLSPVLSRLAPLPDGPCLLRADRVESAASARTPAHRHRGPGLRRLLSGLLLAEVGDQLDRIEPGRAWFESGHEDVVGTNISGGTNVFIRVMLLPRALAGGKSSFIPANPQEAAKPRSATLRLICEHDVPLVT